MKFELEKVKNESYGEFEAVKKSCKELNKHAPLKKRFLRHNNNLFMTKDLRKQILVRSKLRNISNKNRNYENWWKYKCKRNLCLNLLRKTKKNIYLDEKQVSDNKVFRKNVKPSFSDKGVNSSTITLVEKNSIIVDENKIANIMNNYFINITKTLNLKTLNKSQIDIDKFENHISIRKYTKHFQKLFQEVFILSKYPVIS